MRRWAPFPLQFGAEFARMRFTPESPAHEGIAVAVLWHGWYNNAPMTVRELARWAGWGRTRAASVHALARADYEEWTGTAVAEAPPVSDTKRATTTDTKRASTEPPPGSDDAHLREQASQARATNEPENDTKRADRARDLLSTGTATSATEIDRESDPHPTPAPVPLFAIEPDDASQLRAQRRDRFGELVAFQRKHDPQARALDFESYEDALGKALNALRKKPAIRTEDKAWEALSLTWLHWFEGPEPWHRENLHGAKAMAALLRSTKIVEKWESARDWRPSGMDGPVVERQYTEPNASEFQDLFQELRSYTQ
jgi:hypothetical protein